MPTVEKKYTPDSYKGREEFQGSHDVYEMPEENKPSGRKGGHVDPRTVLVILALIVFIGTIGAVIFEILKRSQGFA